MKKLIALALIVLMLIPFAACASYNNSATPDEAAEPTTTNTTTATSSAEVDPNGAVRGKTVNYVYTNSFCGVTFTADKTWSFDPDSSLAAKDGITEDALSNQNLQTTIKGNGVACDVYAQKIVDNKSKAMFTLSYVNGEDPFIKDKSIEEFVDMLAADTGIDVSTAKTENVAYGGRAFCRITFETKEKTTIVAACRINDVIVTIAASATKDSGVDFAEILK